MSNKYTQLKQIFIDDNGVFDYVNLDKSALTYNKILNALQKPLKLILFYGKPGSGKTFLLSKIKSDLEKDQNIVLFKQPFFNETEFILALNREIFKDQNLQITSYEAFMRFYKEQNGLEENVVPQKPYILLLDEAQLYPSELIEKIRLMADTRLFKFLFTVHKTDEEDVLAKDYFKTRIWESVELPISTLSEIRLYLEKKLLYHKFHECFYMFKHDQFELIHKLTGGNLRILNKLMYKIYEIYEYYEEHKPSVISSKHIQDMIIEMAAIDSGLIDA